MNKSARIPATFVLWSALCLIAGFEPGWLYVLSGIINSFIFACEVFDKPTEKDRNEKES